MAIERRRVHWRVVTRQLPSAVEYPKVPAGPCTGAGIRRLTHRARESALPALAALPDIGEEVSRRNALQIGPAASLHMLRRLALCSRRAGAVRGDEATFHGNQFDTVGAATEGWHARDGAHRKPARVDGGDGYNCDDASVSIDLKAVDDIY